ncbi:hypothetical protein M9H77_36812 [Catharanthus roseus]|uniref:Uncharacterized protein n=1 Tax=Catharanthus roseus TaxID=4058 RepID=A0ACB9ZX50_CATRO|nr:hypothetical protein M9H77_36812 [Catharanthus roseus]
MESSKLESTTFKVLMFPWLAHGHVFPYFELANKLTKKNFHIFFCSTAINLSSIKKTFYEKSSSSEIISSIEFVELHLPDMPELPPQYQTTKGLPPNLNSTLHLALHSSQNNFSEIIMNLKPDLLIYDSFQPWAVELASSHKVPSVHFCISSVATMSYACHTYKYGSAETNYPFPEIFVREHEWEKRLIPKIANPNGSPLVTSFKLSHEIVLMKISSREFEGKYLDYLSSLCGKKIVPLGPLVQEPTEIEGDQDLHILNWLNSKNPNSVVFVSFGSECYPSKEEMEEIANGLEQSKANFIWVIRFPAGSAGTVAETVPEGFLERIKDRGIIVEGWAPQAKILQHLSIGGFMSHCGWSSVTESLYYGVPLISMAMQYDQHTNGRFVVGIGVGIEVLRGENGELRRQEIAKVIEEIVGKESGEVLKIKARELKSTIFKVLIFPWLAHGHVFPFFELAKKLANKNFHIFFCSTAINLSSIKKTFKEIISSIEFIELHVPELPQLPPDHHTTKDLPPNLHSTLHFAFHKSKTNFSEILINLKPDLLIYDGIQLWAAEFASAHKIPSVYFYTSGAASKSYTSHMNKYGWIESQTGHKYPFPEIFLREHELKKRSVPKSADTNGSTIVTSFGLSHEIVLIKSSREIEGKYLDYLSSLSGEKMVPLGPLVQEPTEIGRNQDLHIFNWLNSKNPNSVVFVSFGSECYPSKEEMGEIANGLEQSKANFIWVIRFPAGSDGTVEEEIPEGFLERIRDRGIIVEGWAPQAKILRHPSIGGFMSHCGWSSITESLYYGVPLITMGMQYDQYTNGRFVVGIGVGMEVMRDENGEFRWEQIAKVIEEIVVKESGKILKEKARELSEKLKMEEDQLIDEAVEELRMICSEKMQQNSAK